MKKTNYRLPEIDFAKGIGIILVVLGHLNIPAVLRIWIYMFHMPLFFIISGYLERGKKESIRRVLSKKTLQLLVPYYLFGTIIIIFNTVYDAIIYQSFSKLMLMKRIIALIYGNFIWENNYQYIGTLWFLVAMFAVTVIFKTLVIRLYNKYIQGGIVVVLFVFGVLLNYKLVNQGIRLPYCLDVAFIMLLFYYVGYVFKIKLQNLNKSNHNFYSSILMIILGSILGSLNSMLMMYTHQKIINVDVLRMHLGQPILFIFTALLISFGLLGISNSICEKIRIKSIIRCGQLSLPIMVTHIYVLNVLEPILHRLDFDNEWILVFFVFLGSVLCSEIIDRYIPWLYKAKKIKNEKIY